MRRTLAMASGLVLLPLAVYLAAAALWVDSGVERSVRPLVLAAAFVPLVGWGALLKAAYKET